MKNIVAGTAGHIDHGKTALVRALTGIETDRIEEEKRRGISIDLGFAHLELGGLRIGFVDVPGHERFVKNMLAGVSGIDLLLLVIAADESVKPQTREHFEICRLLGIERGIVVLTKCDLVEPEMLELVKLEIEEFVAGSFLRRTPLLAVSSKTGEGIDALKAELAKLGAEIAGRSAEGAFRLPVDRAFSMRGFGTVVTGTLASGSLVLEQEVQAYPGERRMRVRGLQVHGENVERATAGQRTAVNLAGVDAQELHRGLVLADPSIFRATTVVDCQIELLSSAKPLKHGARVHFHAHTAEIEAEVRLLAGSEPVKPGARALIRLILKEPALLWPDDRFILRWFSPVVTVAGGRVADIDPPQRIKRTAAHERAVKLARGGLAERITLLCGEARFGLPAAELVAKTGHAVPAVEGLERFDEQPPWVIAASRLDELADELMKTVAGFHLQSPLQPGMGREDARAKVLPGAPAFLLDRLLARSSRVAADGDVLRLAAHKVTLKTDEDEAAVRMEALFRDAGLAVPPVNEVLGKLGVDANRARTLLQLLLREKKLLRVNSELIYHAAAIAELKQALGARKGQRFGVAEFKEWTGVSRKYAIPLLEFLDRERVTRREGDSRVIL
jgi:selenocysteine-specific elongation factor